MNEKQYTSQLPNYISKSQNSTNDRVMVFMCYGKLLQWLILNPPWHVTCQFLSHGNHKG